MNFDVVFYADTCSQVGLANLDQGKMPHVMRWMDYIQVGTLTDLVQLKN